MSPLALLIKRAQEMCDADGKIRWVKHTSLGWRIELEPPVSWSELAYRIKSKEAPHDRTT